MAEQHRRSDRDAAADGSELRGSILQTARDGGPPVLDES